MTNFFSIIPGIYYMSIDKMWYFSWSTWRLKLSILDKYNKAQSLHSWCWIVISNILSLILYICSMIVRWQSSSVFWRFIFHPYIHVHNLLEYVYIDANYCHKITSVVGESKVNFEMEFQIYIYIYIYIYVDETIFESI